MPTDRARSTALLADLPVGIDTIRVRGPVARNALARLPRQRIRHDVDAATGEIGETRTSSEGTTASGLPWRVDVWRRDTAEAVFEASIPRLLRGDNSQAASVAEVRSVLEEFHAEVGREVDWLCDADGLSLLRLDLVRTFTGDDHRFGPLLDALERIPPKGLLGTRADRDRSHRGVQSLMRYTDRWCTRLYQRSGYYNNKARGASGASRERLLGLANAERGHLRYEAELKSDALRRNSLHIVDDLHRRSLAEVAERYFEVSRFGFRVGGDGNRMAAAADRALAAGTYSTFSASVGELIVQAAGLPSSYRSARTRDKYATTAAELDLTAADIAPAALEAMVLSWATGRLMLGHEAAGVAALRTSDSAYFAHLNARAGATQLVDGRPVDGQERPVLRAG